jgi:RNA polymerase sigma factor (sigma-70 family)
MAQPRLGRALPQINRLFSGTSLVGLSDAELLDRYVAEQDEDAFAALVTRHGPLVWAVCRDVLREPIDVEDAFQATFLILIRRARSIWVEESLGGWLYRVAYRAAVRAKVDSRRRRAKEPTGTRLDAIAAPSGDRIDLAELHDAIARLPERYRRAVILCELEGLTQIDAAKVLRCGEATVRRRLAAARERLRVRLAKQGGASSMLTLARLSITSSATVTWGQRVPSLSAQLLARKVETLLWYSRLIKMTALVGVSVIATATASYALNPRPTDEPRQAAAPPSPSKPAPRVRWVYKKSDTGRESWANLDDGREFRKQGKEVSLLHTEAHDLLTYKGNGAIEKTKARWYADVVDKAGRHIPPSAFDVDGPDELDQPRRTPDEQRSTAQAFSDLVLETIDGHPYLRIDQYVRDALGQARLDKQTWYDRVTRRPARSRERLQVAFQHQYKREFETTLYDYPETGPADLAALGVPRETPVVDQETKAPSRAWADLPGQVREALKAQAEAVRRFPTDFRVLTAGYDNMLGLEYWSAPREFVDLWCDSKVGDSQFFLDDKQPRQFRADNQEPTGRPKELDRAMRGGPEAELPVERIVAWFPFDRSVNIGLKDGQRTYNLTRFIAAKNEPRRTEVHVLSHGLTSFPELIEEQWPLLEWDRRYATPAPPEADTPAGMVVIKVHQPNPDFRCVFTLDPAHDFIAVRQVEWSKNGDQWHLSDKRAVRFKQLPGGSWYVAAWEKMAGFGGNPDQPANRGEIRSSTQLIDVTPIAPDRFPNEIFNGEKFLEDARKGGAMIQVDQ